LSRERRFGLAVERSTETSLLQDFLFWCLLINIGIYTATAVAVLIFRNLVCRIHESLFGLDEAAVMRSVQNCLAACKLLIAFFNFVPRVTVLIIK
jgi:hypothetical protein